jgi:starch synthase (maltosyl-transferring)
MNYLAKIGFSQSYTYFTWKNTAAELRELLHTLTTTHVVEYYRPNFFTNTPDILHEYLQKGGRPAFRVRLLLAATLAPSYGIYSGFELCENVPVREGSEEYLDSEKYQIKTRDFKAPGNIRRDIMRLNSIRRDHPALQRFDNLAFIETDCPEILAYWKSAPGNDLIVIVNLDPHAWHETTVHLPIDRLELAADSSFVVEDLFTGERFTWHGAHNYVRLDPTTRVGHLLRVLRTKP